MERTPSVVVLVINNRSQFLLFLQARPIREEKLNEVWLLSVKGFIIFRKGDSWVVSLMSSRGGGKEGTGMWFKQGRETASVAQAHLLMPTVLPKYLTSLMDMIFSLF